MFHLLKSFFSRQRRYNELIARANEAEPRQIVKLGTVHILPMDPALRLAVGQMIEQETLDTYTFYLYLIGECVVEFIGKNKSTAKLGMQLKNTKVIKALGDAVLEVSGMSENGVSETVKKSKKTQS